MLRINATLCALSALTVALPAAVEARSAIVAGHRAPALSAARRIGAVELDGVMDEQAWRAAPPQDGFWQRHPDEGQPPRFRTEFRVLFDEEALFVGVRAFDPDPQAIRSLLTRRDQESPSDWIAVSVDSYHDKRTAYRFALNPAGVKTDALLYDDVQMDASWDAVWDGAAQVDERGWAVEFRIPFSQLRFADANEQVWGLQVERVVDRTQEQTVWAPWPTEKNQRVSLFGELSGVSGIASGSRFELLPYAVAGVSIAQVDDADPFRGTADGLGGLGLDLKYGLGSGFTLAATVNPDFGQVEADPSQVNLSAQETFFQERRPFFLEGGDIFRFSLAQGDGNDAVEQLFYTRRIGAAPHDSASGDYLDAPAATTIYSAAKLSGKTGSGWSVGVMDAVTGQEESHVAFDDGGRESVIVEPLTNYGVLRLARDANSGRTNVGAVLTTVHRSLEGTGMDWLHDEAYAAGASVNHRFGRDEWSANLRVLGSYVHGSPEALDETQRSSRRYYQRPDADHLDYDPARISLSGVAALWSVGKMAGGHFRFATGGDTRSPGFEVNDLGFQRVADRHVHWLWGQYRDDEPGDTVRSYGINANVWGAWDWAPMLLGVGGNLNGYVTFANYWGGSMSIALSGNRQNPGGLRGGPLLRSDTGYSSWLGLWSDSRRRVRINLNGSGSLVPASLSWSAVFSPSLTWHAMSNLDLSAGPLMSRVVDDSQYVAEVTDRLGAQRYVIGHLEQTTAAMTVRVDYTFTPTLSLQLYAQPFASAGQFESYKEAEAPQAHEYDDRYHTFAADERQALADGTVGIDRDGDGNVDFSFEPADFSFRQLRSNLVLRWEYRPGSSFFLIWSHDRTSSASEGRFDVSDSLVDLADEPGEHVVLAKLNYWFGI